MIKRFEKIVYCCNSGEKLTFSTEDGDCARVHNVAIHKLKHSIHPLRHDIIFV